MKQGKENFEFIKDDDKSRKRNYLLQKDKITKMGLVLIIAIITLLILGVVFIPKMIV